MNIIIDNYLHCNIYDYRINGKSQPKVILQEIKKIKDKNNINIKNIEIFVIIF